MVGPPFRFADQIYGLNLHGCGYCGGNDAPGMLVPTLASFAPSLFGFRWSVAVRAESVQVFASPLVSQHLCKVNFWCL